MVDETIVAGATPPGRGGVGILRLSGPQALSIALQLSLKSTLNPREAHYAHFYDEKKNVIDTGIILYFNRPFSFTGEDVIELQCHGSPIVLDQLLKRCVLLGARIARPGEFSQRAFLNDKMDLTQAEAVADLINATSQTAARMAVKSLQGEFSSQINALNNQIIHLRLYIEATIDFPDEDIDFLADGKVAQLLNGLIDTLLSIRQHAAQGALLREGLSVVIAGPPNAGKSTLINQLASRDVAIVTAIPGTTRDVMREHILIDDLPIHIIDTAGLRESDDLVEQEGIKRAVDEIKRADCILWVTDIQQPISQSWHEFISDDVIKDVPVIAVINKIDSLPTQPSTGPQDKITEEPIRADALAGKCAGSSFSPSSSRRENEGSNLVGHSVSTETNKIFLSAKTGEGLSLLKEQIKLLVGYQPSEGLFLARRRHLEAIDEANAHLQLAQSQLSHAPAAELLAEDLRLAHQCLSEITGEFSSDDLLGKIFSTFCIGK